MADGNFPTYVTQSATLIWTAPVSAVIRKAGTFVNFAGTNSLSLLGFAGVLAQEIPANTTNIPVAVDMEGIVQAISGGAIGIGQGVVCQASTGEFTVAGTAQNVHGRAMSVSTGAGQIFLMKITREGLV